MDGKEAVYGGKQITMKLREAEVGLFCGLLRGRLHSAIVRPMKPRSGSASLAETVLVQTGKRIGDNGIWRIAKLNGILYLPDVGSKTTSFSSAFAGIFASN